MVVGGMEIARGEGDNLIMSNAAVLVTAET
jgi:hypothetical protein